MKKAKALNFDGIPLKKIIRESDRLLKQGKIKKAKRLRYIVATVLCDHYRTP